MLKLQQLKKDYILNGGLKVEALRGVDLCFRKNEFVAILGPSGCGKTTLLNIIGGLDHPTSGSLHINGVSTEKYGDRDWDNYRNHSIGFVFQSYNLIPHMNVLANVELAPTISGVSKAQRRKKSIEALQRVGLGDQLDKKPNQLSGGQMQRVAIARALVNDPEILLADEPTGALDTKTSVQIMDLLREVAKDRLVVMVTHNPELADAYATRIVKLKDGLVVDDSDPYAGEEPPIPQTEPKGRKKEKKAAMSFLTALQLSLRNLMTKKARTLLTSFAGSIGIIGIAAILALSSGMQAYIDKVQEDTLSSYPLYMLRESTDTTAITEVMMQARGASDEEVEYDPSLIYPDDRLVSLFKALSSRKTNDLPSFKKYLETHRSELDGKLSAVSYSYDLNVDVYASLPEDAGWMRSNPSTIFDYMGPAMRGYSAMLAMGGNSNFFSEMLEGVNGEIVSPVVYTQYDLLMGRWPEKANEIVLMLDDNNRISNVSLYALGIKDPNDLESRIEKAMNSDTDSEEDPEDAPFPVETLLGHTFRYVYTTDYFVKSAERHYTANGVEYPVWVDRRDDVNFDLATFLEEYGQTLTVVGILSPNPDATSYSVGTPIGYTAQLTREIIAYNNDSEITKQQLQTKEYDIFSGISFEEATLSPDKAGAFLDLLSADKKAELLSALNTARSAYFTPEALPGLLENLNDDAFAMIVKSYLPKAPDFNFTKEQAGDFVNALSAEQRARLVNSLVMTGMHGVTEETLPQALQTLPDENYQAIVAMYAPPSQTFTKDEIPEFLEAIGQTGQTALLTQLRETGKLTEETLEDALSELPEDQFERLVSYYAGDVNSYDGNLSTIGQQDDSRIRRISLFAVDFDAKDAITAFVRRYNDYAKQFNENAEKDETIGEVELTDVMGSLLSGVNRIINVISIVLIVFVAISLVVSSIMIAIITYISVLERIKEIGILRSLGASKKNISDVFNAETLIEGFVSGVFGVGFTLLLCLIANPIIHKLSGITSINAYLPPLACVILILISVGLTVLAGLVPAILASNKDPVIALRTE